ncbi:MAG: hypothetical protein GY754_18820 [bacterium]|nr:hypothetical protein [bacterium]MCP4133026.1 hypothetical protein [bacterium]
MRKILNLTVFTLSAAILAFSGCEAGLSNGSSNSTDDDSKFSFSEMYSSISNLQQDNTAIRAELATMTGDTATDNTSLQTRITLLETQIAALLTSKAPVESTVPVGAIVAWHKNLNGGVPALASNFAECDGSVISDEDSPLDGRTLPNLNGEGRFLRGSSISGVEQEDNMQGFITFSGVTSDANLAYNFTYGFDTSDVGNMGRVMVTTGGISIRQSKTSGPKNDGTNGVPRIGPETRPTNMSVVWVMRIK